MFYEASRPSYSYRLSFSITAFPFCLLVCLFLPGEGGGFVAIKRLRGGLWLSSRPSSDGGTDSGSPPPPRPSLSPPPSTTQHFLPAPNNKLAPHPPSPSPKVHLFLCGGGGAAVANPPQGRGSIGGACRKTRCWREIFF